MKEAAIIFTMLSFVIGIGTVGSPDSCKYTTILSKINLGYVIGCELGRTRFEPYK
jgi:hypothetical protein